MTLLHNDACRDLDAGFQGVALLPERSWNTKPNFERFTQGNFEGCDERKVVGGKISQQFKKNRTTFYWHEEEKKGVQYDIKEKQQSMTTM